MIFHTEKLKSDGSHDKFKCRLVTLSQHRNRDSIGETFSPTVNPVSLFIQLQEAVVKTNVWMTSYDIKLAFLMTPVHPPDR